MYRHKYRIIVPFLLPALFLYCVFVLYPYAESFYNSLTQWRGVSSHKTFVGLKNFSDLMRDENFWSALRHNGAVLIVIPIITLSIALLFAALFTQGRKGVLGAQAYRVIFFFPQVMSAVAIGLLWDFVYHPNLGVLNGVLRAIGLGALQRTWLGDPRTVLWCIAAVVIWQAVGFYMVLFIAGMQSIPTTFYEAATLDGANRWTAFWKITLPLLWSNLQTALIFIGIGALDLFVFVQVMTSSTTGGPGRAAAVVALYMYDSAFGHSKFGYASAIGVTLLILNLALAMLTMRITRREQFEF
jgi:N-acetylglucosamine transport system permease protein